VTRTPDIRDQLGASTAEVGLVLFGLSLGSMLGILCSGALVSRFGARPVITTGAIGIILSMPTIGVGTSTAAALLAAAGLFLFGAGMGGGEVAMNVEGAEIERVTGRPFLPMLHGCFSLGTVVGAVAGIAATAASFPVSWHLYIVGGLALLAVALAIPALPPGTGRALAASTDAGPRRRLGLWRDSRLWLIGVVILAMALAEGTANDWLPLVMVDGHGFPPALGSTIFAAFAAAMTVGRFAGGWFIERYGRPAVLCASGVSAAVGLVLVIFVDNQIVAAVAVLLWGLGASLGFPVAISAAGDSGPESAARVSLVATVGYIAFLVGPPVLGFVGEVHGLRGALIVPLVVVAAAAAVAPLIGRRPRVPVPAE
jgi:fucose permease